MADDIVTHGVNGALAAQDDVEGLVRGMRWLTEDQTAYERLALNGRRLAERHDWAYVAERYANELYAPLLAAGRTGSEFSDPISTERSQNAA